MARVFIFVTVDAQQFPVAAVGRIVVMIVVLVVHRELLHIRAGEFARAASADPGIDLERLLAIILFAALAIAPGFGNNLVHFASARLRLARWHVLILPLSCVAPKF